MNQVQHQSLSWRIAPDRELSLDQPRLMGILNLTPDSFSDGGKYATGDAAADAALRMRDEGACMIDVGGESTRPGAAPVDAAEQIRRTIPVIQAIRKPAASSELLISIDTTSEKVAQAALDAGANVINDISAGRDDPRMFALASSWHCGIILMHRRTSPGQDNYSDQYVAAPDYAGDVVGAVRRFLDGRCRQAVGAGIDPRGIVVDPGLGFGKNVEQNYELARRVGELMAMGYPILSAASRKSFIGAASGECDPSRRINGTLAISVAHYLAGVRLFRVHDVAAHRQALAVARALG